MSLSILILGHAIKETLRISIPAVIYAWKGTLTFKECDEKLDSWSESLLQRIRLRLQVEGLSTLEAHEPPYVVVSNHQSLYDIPILFQALPFSLRMAAKKELFQTPIWGKAMRAASFVEIDRKNGKRAYEALQAAAFMMKRDKISLHIAPEGTRSKDGTLGRFKKGAFEIVRRLDFPLLPVAIHGAFNVHRSGDGQVKTGQTVIVELLPLLAWRDFASSDEMRKAVQSSIEEALLRRTVRTVSQKGDWNTSHN